MTQAEILRSRKLGEKVTAALRRRYFEAYYCENVQEAREKALSLTGTGRGTRRSGHSLCGSPYWPIPISQVRTR